MVLLPPLTPSCQSYNFTIQLIYTFFTFLVTSRVSPVPNHTFHTYRFLYTGSFFDATFQVSTHLPWSSPICTRFDFSYFLLSETFLTTRQNSLYVTVYIIARSVFTSTLSSRLAPYITVTHWE